MCFYFHFNRISLADWSQTNSKRDFEKWLLHDGTFLKAEEKRKVLKRCPRAVWEAPSNLVAPVSKQITLRAPSQAEHPWVREEDGRKRTLLKEKKKQCCLRAIKHLLVFQRRQSEMDSTRGGCVCSGLSVVFLFPPPESLLLCRSVFTGGKRQDLIGASSITLTPGGEGLSPGSRSWGVEENSAEVMDGAP